VLGNKLNTLSQKGFTIVELLLAISLTAIIGVTFITVASNYLVIITRASQLNDLTMSSQNLLRSTVENIRYGDGVRQTNQITDANAPIGGWNTSNTAFVIIIPVPALNLSKNYIIDSSTGSPYMNELVYYKSGSTLMERKLADPNAIGNIMKTSCPSGYVTSTCPADILLASYVSSMTFTLYDQNATVTSTASLARSVKIDLTMTRNSLSNQPITSTNNIRVTLRNRF
jgi:prepilin-type N-terminal cleavage/methylation domain-containing protein